jgi:integrase
VPDDRKLERTTTPGIYRRHGSGCAGKGRCRCPYVVVWKQHRRSRKQLFPTFELAREFKSRLGAGTAARRPLSSETVADYYAAWFPHYRGRTSRGLDESTRVDYEASFRLHILPLALASLRMRDLGAPDIRRWLSDLERRGASPNTVRKAKAALSVMLASGVEDGDIAANPAIGVRYVPSDQDKRRHSKRERRALSAADVQAILAAMDGRWQAFFTLLVQTGLRVGEALGLTWGNVHLGDDAHLMVTEQVRRGQRKRLKTDASVARVPLSPTMAAWLSELRPAKARPDSPVFASKTGTALNYANIYHRVLKPALEVSGIAVKVGEREVVKRGETVTVPVYDYQGVAFHAFRKACGSLLLHEGKTLKQVQGWLRHSQLTTTMNVYIQQVDQGLGGAEVWERILPRMGPAGATPGATTRPEEVANQAEADSAKMPD